MSNIKIIETTSKSLSIKLAVKGIQEVYSLKSPPAVTSQLVLISKREILQNLQLQSVISNLKNAADLMFVAYNSLAGTKVQSEMSGLQKSLLDVSADCITTVTAFEAKSQEVIRYTIKSYKWLFDVQEKLAVKQLQRCGKLAGEMALEAEILSKRFQEIGTQSQNVLEDAIKERNLEHEKKKEFEKKLNDLKANQANAKKLQQELAKASEEVEELYIEAKDREKVESDRAFIMGLASIAASGFSSYLNAAATVASSAIRVSMAASPTMLAMQTIKQQANQAKSQGETDTFKEKENLIKELEQVQEKRNKIQQERDENLAKIKATEGILKDDPDAETVADKEKELADLRQRRKDIEVELEKTTQSVNNIIAKSGQETSAKIDQLGNQAQTAADSAAQQKMVFFKQKSNLAKQSRQTLAALEEYSLRVKNTQVDVANAAIAVDTLHYAVRAISEIVVSLNQASLFWRSMERYCKRLEKSEFLNDLQDLQELDKEDRIKYYYQADFMQGAVISLCRWVALNNVCHQYLEAVNETYRKVGENIKASPSILEAQKQAPLLAERILNNVREQMKAIDEEMKTIEVELQ